MIVGLKRLTVCLTVFTFTTSQTNARNGHPDYGKPTAIVISFGVYQQADKLEYTIESSVALAQALANERYKVRFLTGVEDKVDLPAGLAENPNISVEYVTTGREVDRILADWVQKSFRTGAQIAPFGFVFINGHGEQRLGDQFLLAPEDEHGKASVNLDDHSRAIGREILPVYFVFDSCRLKVQASDEDTAAPNPSFPKTRNVREGQMRRRGKGEVLADEVRGTTRIIKGGVDTGFASQTLTHIYSTKEGSVALSSPKNLTKFLADGLAHVEKNGYAATRTEPQQTRSKLSINQWLSECFRLASKSDWIQRGQMIDSTPGFFDTGFVIACRDSGFEFRPPSINFANHWKQGTGGQSTDMTSESTTFGLKITRADHVGNNLLWETMILDGRNSQNVSRSDVTSAYQKYLVLEAIATRPTGVTANELQCQIHAGNFPKKHADYYNEHLTTWRLPYGKTVWFSIPMTKAPRNAPLRTLSFAAPHTHVDGWPPGASLTIRHISVRSKQELGELTRTVKRLEALPQWDLLNQWWPGDHRFVTPPMRPNWSYLKNDEGGRGGILVRLPPQPDGSTSPLGGPIAPGIAVKADAYELVVEFSPDWVKELKSNGQAPELTCYLEADGLPLLDETHLLDDSDLTKGLRFTIPAGGIADYFLIASKSKTLQLSNIRLDPIRRKRR